VSYSFVCPILKRMRISNGVHTEIISIGSIQQQLRPWLESFCFLPSSLYVEVKHYTS